MVDEYKKNLIERSAARLPMQGAFRFLSRRDRSHLFVWLLEEIGDLRYGQVDPDPADLGQQKCQQHPGWAIEEGIKKEGTKVPLKFSGEG